MTTAIDTLMNEHRVIEDVLTALESAATSAANGAQLDRNRVAEFADFFRNFADTCHHGKEEDLLFKRMTDFGFPREHGPIAVMLFDHQTGREHVGALRAIGEASGALATDERASFVQHAEAYVALLRQHIQKEDRVLYPMAAQTIPPADMAHLVSDFADFERNVMGAGEHERFHRLADFLVEAYRVKGGSPEGSSAGCGCHGHSR